MARPRHIADVDIAETDSGEASQPSLDLVRLLEEVERPAFPAKGPTRPSAPVGMRSPRPFAYD